MESSLERVAGGCEIAIYETPSLTLLCFASHVASLVNGAETVDERSIDRELERSLGVVAEQGRHRPTTADYAFDGALEGLAGADIRPSRPRRDPGTPLIGLGSVRAFL